MKSDRWLKVELATLLAASFLMVALALRSGWQQLASWL